ncbi:2-oxoacid:acceptor oxidoreductase subunit alpha [Rhodoplanes sp. SY1]|uniref:2-oxoacid:acceptor oxidoreductase subunit alpha n=1 Tax=Rhodoplanes sp. SY1 TaxID=3166646 RepID=UPI0038B56CEA
MKNHGRLLQGNEAMAQGAIYAGARFYAGYPITPSSEIAQECSRVMPKLGGVYMQMEDEIASMAAIIGASLTGAKSFTATSGPGFSLMQENLGLAIMGEVPCVVMNVQRSGPSTGLATKPAQSDIMQIRWGRHGDQELIALSPSSVAECFSLTVEAFNLAERLRTPVVIAADEIVAHMRENIVIPDAGEIEVIDRAKPTGDPAAYRPFAPAPDGVPPISSYGSEYIMHVSSSMHGPDGYSNNSPENAARQIARKNAKFEHHRAEIVKTKAFEADDADILLVAFGTVTRAARAAAAKLRAEGVKAGVLQLVTVWPFPSEAVAELGGRARTVVVPEMNYHGQIAGEVKKVLGADKDVRRVNGWNGQIITPRDILKAI